MDVTTRLDSKPRVSPRMARAKRIALAVLLSLTIAAVGLELNRRDIAVVETLDKMIGDWRIALGSPRAAAPRGDIAVVLVTEQTLADYESRSPIDRGLLAELVRAIDKAEPRAIALDIILDRRTRSDDRLIAALKQVKSPVILGAIDSRVRDEQGLIPTEALGIQRELHAVIGRPTGHIMLERKVGLLPSAGDTTVRLLAGPDDSGSSAASLPAGVRGASAILPLAFADAIAQAVGVAPKPGRQVISWLKAPADGHQLFPVIRVPRHPPTTVAPALAGLIGAGEREIVNGRIVIIGADMIDRDRHTTPLSVLEGPVGGVMIHAQALAQRLDGNRDIMVWPWPMNLAIVAAVAFACFSAARKLGINARGFTYGAVGLALIGLASFAAFWLLRLDIPSIALATAWAAGGLGGFVSEAVYKRLGVEVASEI